MLTGDRVARSSAEQYRIMALEGAAYAETKVERFPARSATVGVLDTSRKRLRRSD